MAIITLSYSDANGPHSIDLDRDSTSIGRSPNQEFVLNDPCVSRHHAVIVREGNTYTVVDQNSTHGTFLNSKRVERAVLKFGDVLQMGSLKGPQLRFQLRQYTQTTSDLLQSQVTVPGILDAIARGNMIDSPGLLENNHELSLALVTSQTRNPAEISLGDGSVG